MFVVVCNRDNPHDRRQRRGAGRWIQTQQGLCGSFRHQDSGRPGAVRMTTKSGQRNHGGEDPTKEFERAVRLLEAGHHSKAAKVAALLAGRLPRVPDIRQLQGAIALESGKPEKAITYLQKGLASAPGSPPLNDLMGTALGQTGRHVEAIVVHRRALGSSPDDPGFLNNMGNALKQLGHMEEARGSYQKSLKKHPDNPDGWCNLGLVLIELENYEQAEDAFRQALDYAPDLSDARVNLAYVLMEQRRFGDAVDCCRRALDLDPAHVDALNNLARACMCRGDHRQAAKAIEKAVVLDPNHIGAQQAMAIQHFLHGRWSQAWACYETRWQIETARKRRFPQPLWQGEPIRGRTLLVWGEQGVGDEIMFTSMVPDLVEQGANVILELDTRLLDLYRRSFPDLHCVAREDPPAPGILQADIDFQTPCGGLGRWLRPDEASFPKRTSFLKADMAQVEILRRRYREGAHSHVVGVSWRSLNHDIGDDKSMDVTSLGPLAKIPGIRLVDLQYGDTSADCAVFEKALGVKLLRDPEIDPLQDLDGFAAHVSAMDLVVSISNTTAHMAGALGVPAWVMVPVTPLWRWMMNREDSPWYSSLRLLRQAASGDWNTVIEEVRSELAKLPMPSAP